jgi:hypothetical protein
VRITSGVILLVNNNEVQSLDRHSVRDEGVFFTILGTSCTFNYLELNMYRAIAIRILGRNYEAEYSKC